MAERRRRPTREELDERLRFVLGKIPVSVIDGVRPEPEVTPVATVPAKPETSNGNGNGNGHSHGRVVGGRITGAGEG